MKRPRFMLLSAILLSTTTASEVSRVASPQRPPPPPRPPPPRPKGNQQAKLSPPPPPPKHDNEIVSPQSRPPPPLRPRPPERLKEIEEESHNTDSSARPVEGQMVSSRAQSREGNGREASKAVRSAPPSRPPPPKRPLTNDDVSNRKSGTSRTVAQPLPKSIQTTENEKRSESAALLRPSPPKRPDADLNATGNSSGDRRVRFEDSQSRPDERIAPRRPEPSGMGPLREMKGLDPDGRRLESPATPERPAGRMQPLLQPGGIRREGDVQVRRDRPYPNGAVATSGHGPPQQQWRPPSAGVRDPAGRQRQYQQRPRQPGSRPPEKNALVVRKSPRPAWRRVLNRIEQSLDGLADLEDAVSGRAQKLYSATVASVKIPQVFSGSEDSLEQTMMSSSTAQQQPRFPRRRAEKKATPTPQMDMSRFQKKVLAKPQPTNTAEKGGGGLDKKPVPTSPYGALLENTRVVKPETDVQSQPSRQRSTEWHDIVSGKSARVVGGASHQDEERRMVPARPGPQASSGMQRAQQSRPNPPGPSSGNAFGQPISKQSSPTDNRQEQRQVQRPKGPPRTTKRRARLDSDDDRDSLMSRFVGALPTIPRINLNPFARQNSFETYSSAALEAWKVDDEEEGETSKGLFGLFKGSSVATDQRATGGKEQLQDSKLSEPLADLLERCSSGGNGNLLTSSESRRCASIGRYQAVFDTVGLLFIIAGVRQIPLHGTNVPPPNSLADALTVTVPAILWVFASSLETWAPFAFASAFMTGRTRAVVCDKALGSLQRSISSTLREEAEYGSLYLRLASLTNSNRKVPARIQEASQAQIEAKVGIARLRTFVACVFAVLVATSLPDLSHLFHSFLNACVKTVTLPPWRSWPPQWLALYSQLKAIVMPLGDQAAGVFAETFLQFLDDPLKYVYEVSVAAALVMVSLLPYIEHRRGVASVPSKDAHGDDEDEDEMHLKFTGQVSNLGISGATRLVLHSAGDGLESLLERWRMSIPQGSARESGGSLQSLARLCCYGILSGALLSFPVYVHSRFGITTSASASRILINWDSLLEIAILLVLTHGLVWNALVGALAAADLKSTVAGFLESLSTAAEERRKALNAPMADLKLLATVSPTSGIVARDLWAAHSTRRAWAVRGANIVCRSGESILVLGDDGSGKTRLLTTIAEAIVAPPSRSLTATRVRGSVSVGGLDVSKWDGVQLRRRFACFLNDVRTVSDLAQVFSGLSLEEIVEPVKGVRSSDVPTTTSSSERAAMMLALKMTGLDSSLLPRLPSKLATTLTANEEDLAPSLLRPRFEVVSPSEWSKILLARVLAQSIQDNDNSAGSNDELANCLMGSVLLLDDVMSHLSEVEEARFWQDLRKSAAATIISSNRWASGRFADKIMVMKNGAIVESGTHTELLSRGPQQSIYAAKWYAMSTQ